jgi:hypothetical protein
MKSSNALRDRLAELADYKDQLGKYPYDDALRKKAGYCALHAAREAAEIVYQNTFAGVSDVAPGLQGPQAYVKSQESLRDLLRQVLSDEIATDPTDPLNRLAMALRRKEADPMGVGVAATQASVALLGLHELGGIFGAWQVVVLAFSQMDWREHVEFNQRVLKDAEQLHPEVAMETAQLYELPGLSYLKAGCHGNVAKAAYRAVAEQEDPSVRREAIRIGDRAMAVIENEFDDETRTLLIFPTMQAMQVACAEAMGERDAAVDFWDGLGENRIQEVLKKLKEIEPSEALVKLVQTSARNWAECVHR